MRSRWSHPLLFLFGHLIQLSLFNIAIFLIATLSQLYRKALKESAQGVVSPQL